MLWGVPVYFISSHRLPPFLLLAHFVVHIFISSRSTSMSRGDRIILQRHSPLGKGVGENPFFQLA